MTNKEMKKPRPNITRSGRSGRKEGKGVNQFESYLKTILTDKQIQVLADAVLTQNIVCLYGAGLGKSTLARIFKSAGIRSVLAPRRLWRRCRLLYRFGLPGNHCTEYEK